MDAPSNHHPLDLLPAYALNALDADEARKVAEHLETCAECRREEATWARAADQIALGAPAAEAPPGLKQRLIARVRPAAPRHARPATVSFWRRLWGAPRPVVVAWQLATLLILVTLGASNVAVWRQVDRDVTAVVEAGLQTIRLKGTELAPAAKGLLVIAHDGKHGMLYVDGLPFLETRRVYQAWLGEVTRPLNAGTLSLNEQGYGFLEVYSRDQPLADYPQFHITIEPAGGSPRPSDNVALISYRP